MIEKETVLEIELQELTLPGQLVFKAAENRTRRNGIIAKLSVVPK